MVTHWRRRPVSMADVARSAAVSVTTVSHVVNKTRSVSADTEARVLQAIVETGYVPDNVVRSMRTVGSQTIGLAMSAISNPYFGEVVQSIEQRLSKAGYSLLLVDTHDESIAEMRAVSDLLKRHVDAIILAPSASPHRALRYARARNVPVVIIDRAVDGDYDQVTAENVEPTATLVDHLAQLGHRRIAMVHGRDGLTTSKERVQGFRRGLKRNRLRFRRMYVVDGDSTDRGAQEAFGKLLALADRPSALIVGNNIMTIGVLRAARANMLKIPQQMALACFDDFEWAELFHPGLTTISQPTHLMGRQAADLALSRLKDPQLPARRVTLSTAFMHRESCGCAASS